MHQQFIFNVSWTYCPFVHIDKLLKSFFIDEIQHPFVNLSNVSPLQLSITKTLKCFYISSLITKNSCGAVICQKYNDAFMPIEIVSKNILPWN